MIKALPGVAVVTLFLYSCNLKQSGTPPVPPDMKGVLNLKTQFYDTNGKPVYTAPMKIWYYDSVAIEELVTIRSVTDTLKRTTVSFIPYAYKYIDLRSNTWYDYKTFTDTSRIINKGILPDSIFDQGGWVFYKNNLPMKNPPEALPDTIIRGIKYMRIKFSPLKQRSTSTNIIGYLRCDNKGKLFSLEKSFSFKVNCTMTRYYEFKDGALTPFASNELEFLSDTLTVNEFKVFDAWKKNRDRYPVY